MYTFVDIKGGGGNDVLLGDNRINRLDGGDGDDFIAGGLGFKTLIGGAGNDTILTAFSPPMPSRVGPEDAWVAPAEAKEVLNKGATWGTYTDAAGRLCFSTHSLEAL
jgi:hypothetical protein